MDSKLANLLRKLYKLAEPGAEAYGSANSPMSPEHANMMLSGLLDFTPVIGDAKSVYEGVQSARQGDWLGAGLGAVGALPFVPSFGGIVKKLPLEPGKSSIPDGMVRLYHQTNPKAAEAIGNEGLSISKAKGIEGPKAIYADEKGFYGDPRATPTVEFFVSKDKWNSPYVMQDVPTNQILGVHLPWHSNARYLLDPENKASLDAALSGRFDNRDGDTAEAIRYVKELLGK